MNKLEVIDTCPIEKQVPRSTVPPDDTMFEETVYDYDVLKQDSRETAFLTKDCALFCAICARIR